MERERERERVLIPILILIVIRFDKSFRVSKMVTMRNITLQKKKILK